MMTKELNNMENNLFNYATKELSQDAFICWLMSYAKEGSKADVALTECAKNLIKKFIPDLETANLDEIIVTEIEKQHKNIDVLLTVNNKYKVIIEDKTSSMEHDNQLKRYYEEIKTEFPGFEVLGIFFKTGFQSDYSEVDSAGYIVFDLNTILKLFQPFVEKIHNNIFLDFYEYYFTFQHEAKQFDEKPVNEWDWRQVNAFYDYIKKNHALVTSSDGHIMDCNYGYVPNYSGGFDGMWFYNSKRFDVNGTRCEFYLQLEFAEQMLNLCFKAKIYKEDKSVSLSDIRKLIVWKESENGRWDLFLKKYNFEKPSRFGNGNTMTFGIFNERISSFIDAQSVLKHAIDNYYSALSELEETFQLLKG